MLNRLINALNGDFDANREAAVPPFVVPFDDEVGETFELRPVVVDDLVEAVAVVALLQGFGLPA